VTRLLTNCGKNKENSNNVAVCLSLFILPMSKIKNSLFILLLQELLTHYLKFPDKGSLWSMKWVILQKSGILIALVL
jgi:hypothetical protein